MAAGRWARQCCEIRGSRQWSRATASRRIGARKDGPPDAGRWARQISNAAPMPHRCIEMSLFAELKRRNVHKVAVAYIIAGWALSQGIAQVFPVFDVPNWVIRLIVLFIIIGLPIALVLAWMFELTPQGIMRTEAADAMPQAARLKKHVWIYVVVIGAAISIGLFFLGRYTAGNKTAAA